MKIFDFHVHAGDFSLLRDDIQALLLKRPHDTDLTSIFSKPDRMMAYLKQHDVVKSVILAECGPGTNFSIDSKLITEYCKDNDFFIPFGSINPNYHDVAEEFQNSIAYGVKGFKFYPADHSFDPTTPEMVAVYQQCEQLGLPVMFHTGLTAQKDTKQQYIKPSDFVFIADKFPALKLILAHAGKPHWFDEAVSHAIKYTNLYLDTALVEPDDIARLCNSNHEVVNKILFGSDLPVVGGYKALVKKYKDSSLTAVMLEKIFYQNAEKIFQKEYVK